MDTPQNLVNIESTKMYTPLEADLQNRTVNPAISSFQICGRQELFSLKRMCIILHRKTRVNLAFPSALFSPMHLLSVRRMKISFSMVCQRRARCFFGDQTVVPCRDYLGQRLCEVPGPAPDGRNRTKTLNPHNHITK